MVWHRTARFVVIPTLLILGTLSLFMPWFVDGGAEGPDAMATPFVIDPGETRPIWHHTFDGMDGVTEARAGGALMLAGLVMAWAWLALELRALLRRQPDDLALLRAPLAMATPAMLLVGGLLSVYGLVRVMDELPTEFSFVSTAPAPIFAAFWLAAMIFVSALTLRDVGPTVAARLTPEATAV